MEIIESICMGNPGGHFPQRLLFEFLCIETTFWITRRHLLSHFGSAPKCLLKEKRRPSRARKSRVFRVERPSLRVQLTSPPLRIIRAPGVGRQQSVPVRGGEKREQRRYFLRGSLLGAGECGTRAGERPPGEHQENQSSTEPASPGRPLRPCTLFGGLHNIPVKYYCF